MDRAGRATAQLCSRRHAAEAEVLQRARRNAGNPLPVCCGQYSVLLCGLLGGSIAATDQAGSVIGCRQDTFEAVVERRYTKQTVIYLGKPGPPSPPCTGQTEGQLLASLSLGPVQDFPAPFNKNV